MQHDALSNLRKLPPMCYGVLNEETVIIARGGAETLPVSIDRSLVDIKNHQLGVSFQQRLAMECGATFGWNQPGADPDWHGPERTTPKTYTVAFPMLGTVKVVAYSEYEAFQLAKEKELIIINDGAPSIVGIESCD